METKEGRTTSPELETRKKNEITGSASWQFTDRMYLAEVESRLNQLLHRKRIE